MGGGGVVSATPPVRFFHLDNWLVTVLDVAMQPCFDMLVYRKFQFLDVILYFCFFLYKGRRLHLGLYDHDENNRNPLSTGWDLRSFLKKKIRRRERY